MRMILLQITAACPQQHMDPKKVEKKFLNYVLPILSCCICLQTKPSF